MPGRDRAHLYYHSTSVSTEIDCVPIDTAIHEELTVLYWSLVRIGVEAIYKLKTFSKVGDKFFDIFSMHIVDKLY